MPYQIIESWNAEINPEDEVYALGDVVEILSQRQYQS